jgi:restriction endonuclease Mrr
LQINWFEDKGKPVKNYKCVLTILDEDIVNVDWLHYRARCNDISKLNDTAPKSWKSYIKGNINKLDIYSKSILKKEDQLPKINSTGAKLLTQLHNLHPTEFEAVVVEIFKKLPHVSHKIIRTRPSRDGGFDFVGEFSIPYPLNYDIEFLGEVKKYERDNRIEPKHISRLVARLNRGQFGIFVTLSYYTDQAQKEVIEDNYPVRLYSGIDIVNMLHELRLVENETIKQSWIDSIKENM